MRTYSLFECGSACGSRLTAASPKGTPNGWGGSKGRDVDGGAPGAARAGPEGAGGGVRGGRDRGPAGARRPAAGRARDAGPARGRRGRVAPAGGRALAEPAGRLPAVADRVDGLITTDKFCFVRCGRLALPRRRGSPAAARPPLPAEDAVPGGAG